jgi:hypothetical protein
VCKLRPRRSGSSRSRADSCTCGRVDADGIELYLDQSLGNPEELVIEAKGRRRKHVHAYWDGCAYVADEPGLPLRSTPSGGSRAAIV